MYDVIVIGQDVSTLMAAIRSAQLGKKVVLLSENAPPDRVALAEYSFDLDPFPWPAIDGLENIPDYSYLRLFSPPEENRDDRFHSGLQVVHPEHRIDFLTGKFSHLKELSREFPGRSPELAKFLDSVETADQALRSMISLVRSSRVFPGAFKIGPKLVRSLVSWSLNTKVLKDLPELGAMLQAQSSIFSNSCWNGEIPFSAACLLSLPMKGTGSLSRKKWMIMDELRQVLRSFGAGFFGNCSITRLMSGRTIEAVIRNQDQEMILSGESLILSAKWKGMKHLIQDEKISKWIRRHAKLKKKALYPFTLHLGVNEKGLPERMADEVIVLNGEPLIRPVAGCDLIFVQAGGRGDPKRAPAGRRAVSATLFLETSPCDMEDDRIGLLPEMILDRLKFFLPFLKENVDRMDPAMSIDLSRRYQEIVNGKYGANGGRLGFPLFADMMPKRNIAITGGELFPGLGFEGEIISGIDAANRISGGKR